MNYTSNEKIIIKSIWQKDKIENTYSELYCNLHFSKKLEMFLASLLCIRRQSLEKVSLFVQEEDNQTMNDNDAELMKRLRKQNRRVIASVRGGRKTAASRNSYKDKGGKSSHSSKMQKQLSGW